MFNVGDKVRVLDTQLNREHPMMFWDGRDETMTNRYTDPDMREEIQIGDILTIAGTERGVAMVGGMLNFDESGPQDWWLASRVELVVNLDMEPETYLLYLEKGDMVAVEEIDEIGVVDGGPYEGLCMDDPTFPNQTAYGVYYRVKWNSPPFDILKQQPHTSNMMTVLEENLRKVEDRAPVQNWMVEDEDYLPENEEDDFNWYSA